MKIASWNVNGIRAAARSGFLDWLRDSDADVVCLQEVKATAEQLDPGLARPEGYESVWHSAQKPGYSGTAIYTRARPEATRLGIGIPEIDSEGRVLIADFGAFLVLNAYFPNSQRDHARLPYKLSFCREIIKVCDALREEGRNLILCGDFNIAHREIDLANPKSNQDNAGFLPEERGWLDTFTGAGYVDAFRRFEPGPGHYTWWSYRPGVRARNIGWRLDYHFVNPEFAGRLKSCVHQPQVKGSDHCPVMLEVDV